MRSSHRPLPSRAFLMRRLGRSGMLGLAMVLSALTVGVCGYHFTADLPWLDALVDASMILSGMGPVDPIRNDAGKWFESFYALFSGVVFITAVGVLMSPLVHRFLHRFHLEVMIDQDQADAPQGPGSAANLRAP